MSEALQGEIVRQDTPVRLTKYDEEIVSKLETAFHNAFNIQEACYYANISRDTFYRWLAEDDAFSYRMSVAQGQVNRKAKEIVAQGIAAGDTSLALRFLMLKDPDFKPKAEVSNNTEQVETRQKIKEFLDDRNDNDGGSEPIATDSETGNGEVASTPTDIS